MSTQITKNSVETNIRKHTQKEYPMNHFEFHFGIIKCYIPQYISYFIWHSITIIVLNIFALNKKSLWYKYIYYAFGEELLIYVITLSIIFLIYFCIQHIVGLKIFKLDDMLIIDHKHLQYFCFLWIMHNFDIERHNRWENPDIFYVTRIVWIGTNDDLLLRSFISE